jgi:uncharacterized membrane protein YbhN (UPF0104 family)
VKKKWLRLLGSAALVAVLAWWIDWGKAAAAVGRANGWLWLAGLGVYLLAQAASALRWRLLARAQGFGGSYGRYLAYYFIGMFFNLLLPTSVGGDVVRTWHLARREGDALPKERRRAAAFLSVFGDRANGLLALVAVAGVAALCCPAALPAWVGWTVAGLVAGAAVGLASLPWLGRLGSLHPRLRVVADAAAVYARNPRTLLAATALSLGVQAASAVLAWLMGAALGLPVPPAYYGVVAPLTALLALLPISVNGVGLREAAAVLLLAPLGVGPAEAVTFSVLTFAAATAASLGGAGCLLFGRFPRYEEVRPDDDVVRGDPDQGRAGQPPAAA